MEQSFSDEDMEEGGFNDYYMDDDSYMSGDSLVEDLALTGGEVSCKPGDVFILPDDAEIHNTRIILQGKEI